MRLKFALAIVVLGLSGCSHQYPLVPKPEATQEIEGSKITYILPNDIEQMSDTIHGLKFLQYEEGTPNKIERLYITKKANQLEIERRTDNGVAGSAAIYTVNLDVISKPDTTTITFTPKTQRTYQQGLLLPFPVPSLDLESYLLDGMVYYRFEITADYPPEAVKASLKRLLSRGFDDDSYTLDNENERFSISVRIHPYRHNQSKVIIDATINNKSTNRTVNMVEKIKMLKTKLQGIVNS